MVDLSTAVGIGASLMLGLGVVAMLGLAYIGYKQDKREVENEESEESTAA